LIYCLGGGNRLRMFENKMQMSIHRHKTGEVTEGLIKLHKYELHNLYIYPNNIMVIKSRRMRWMTHVSRMGDMRNAFKILVGKSEGKRPCGRQNRR
jgi:hypothetical protein